MGLTPCVAKENLKVINISRTGVVELYHAQRRRKVGGKSLGKDKWIIACSIQGVFTTCSIVRSRHLSTICGVQLQFRASEHRLAECGGLVFIVGRIESRDGIPIVVRLVGWQFVRVGISHIHQMLAIDAVLRS